MGELAADPAGTVALLKKVLTPAALPIDANVDRAVAGLDAAAFRDWEAAAKALEV